MANIFPEVGDDITEANWQALNRALFGGVNIRVSGMGISAGTGLAVDVASGIAVISNCVVEFTATETLTGLTASTTNHIWLNSSGTLSATTSDDAPSTSHIPLGQAITDGTSVTSVQGVRAGKKLKSPWMSFSRIDGGDEVTVTGATNGNPTSVPGLTTPNIYPGEVWLYIHSFQFSRDANDIRCSGEFTWPGQYTVYSYFTGDGTNDGSATNYGWYHYTAGGAANAGLVQTGGGTTNMPALGWTVLGIDNASSAGSGSDTTAQFWGANIDATDKMYVKSGSWVLALRLW